MLPRNAANQIATFNKSRTGTSHAGEIKFLSGVNRRCRFCARKIRNKQNAGAMIAPHGIANENWKLCMAPGSVSVADNFDNPTMNQSIAHSVTLDKMLKKYGAGWHTRMVRAQRS